MSLIPNMFDIDSWIRRRNRFWETDQFGVTSPDEMKTMLNFPKMTLGGSQLSTRLTSPPLTTIGKDGFQACIDIQHFQPNEVSVKTINDTIIVEAKHEDRQDDHGYISRSFYRKYVLPAGYDPKDVISTLSSDGILTIKAPNPIKAIEPAERVVEIQKIGTNAEK